MNARDAVRPARQFEPFTGGVFIVEAGFVKVDVQSFFQVAWSNMYALPLAGSVPKVWVILPLARSA